MNANKPASIHPSLNGFVRRGGLTDEHRDGWGIAFFEDAGCSLYVDHRPSADSALARYLQQHPIRSRNIIAHIRKATRGGVAPENCHPFARRLWGRHWAFAHNGHLKGPCLPLTGRYRPLGATDSEHAFCYLLDSLATRFPSCAPDDAELFTALAELAQEISTRGSFNFLLSDGRGLYAHCSTELHHLRRAYPFAHARLIDQEEEVDFGRLNHLDDCMTLIATRPITHEEPWIAFEPGELKYFAHGDERPAGLNRRLELALAV